MNVIGLNHINIRTDDIEASVRFYVDIFGFKHSFRPARPSDPDAGLPSEDDNWLYDGSGNPIIHFRLQDSSGSGPIDHIALTCRAKNAIIDRLRSKNIHFIENDSLAAEGIQQVYLRDPHGVALELNFSLD